jgi:hypothetical protein
MVVTAVPIQSTTVMYYIILHPFAPLTVIYTVLSCIIVSDFMLPVIAGWVSQPF